MQIDAWHGTNRTFDSFSRDHLGSVTGDASCLGFFFACDRDSAEAYARRAERRGGGAARVLQARIRLESPCVIPETGGISTSAIAAILKRAVDRGHDAVIFRDILDHPRDDRASDHVVIFDPGLIEILETTDLEDEASPAACP
jgi:hypothetical protein